METRYMTNENLIKNLCDRANVLWPPDNDFSVTFVAIYVCTDMAQAWFSYWSNDKRDPVRYDIEGYMAEGNDLNKALLNLESFLSVEEEKEHLKREEQSEEYLDAHRELILAGIGFGD